MTIFLVLAVLMASSSSREPPVREMSASYSTMNPREIPWEMTIDQAGRVWFKLIAFEERYQVSTPLRPDVLAEVQAVIRAQRFCELADSYGEIPLHGPDREISVRCGHRIKTVTIYTIWWSSPFTAAQRSETKRALRVWIAFRNLVPDSRAFDTRPADRAFLRLGA